MSAHENMHICIAMSHLEGVRKALDDGADCNEAANEAGWLPIHGAASAGSVEVLDLLVERKADISAASGVKQQLPLHLAAKEGHLAVVERLLALRVDIEAKNCDRTRPIHYACMSIQDKVVRCLINANCDPLTPDKGDCTPWDYTRLSRQQGIDGHEAEFDKVQDILRRIGADKGGGGVMEVPEHAQKVTGIIANVGEAVNKPGPFWWDPDHKRVTNTLRPLGQVHPNLPPDVVNWQAEEEDDN